MKTKAKIILIAISIAIMIGFSFLVIFHDMDLMDKITLLLIIFGGIVAQVCLILAIKNF